MLQQPFRLLVGRVGVVPPFTLARLRQSAAAVLVLPFLLAVVVVVVAVLSLVVLFVLVRRVEFVRRAVAVRATTVARRASLDHFPDRELRTAHLIWYCC